jgi:hypothetical protein
MNNPNGSKLTFLSRVVSIQEKWRPQLDKHRMALRFEMSKPRSDCPDELSPSLNSRGKFALPGSLTNTRSTANTAGYYF